MEEFTLTYDILNDLDLMDTYAPEIQRLRTITSGVGIAICVPLFAYRIFAMNRDVPLGEDMDRTIADIFIRLFLTVLLLLYFETFWKNLFILFDAGYKFINLDSIQTKFFEIIEKSLEYSKSKQSLSPWKLLSKGIWDFFIFLSPLYYL